MTKYNSRKITVDDVTFDSLAEYHYYVLLKTRRANGEIQNFELQPRYLLQPAFKYNGKTERKVEYVADFLIYHNDGTEEAIDVKGMASETAKLKRKLFLYRYPYLKLTWLCRNLKHGDKDGWIEYDELKHATSHQKRSQNGL